MSQDDAKDSMTCREAGSKGGTIVRQRYGKEFYQAIGRLGGKATKQNHGPEYYEELGRSGGRKGGESTSARHGKTFYEAIGKKGGQRVRDLIALGKAAAAESERADDLEESQALDSGRETAKKPKRLLG